MSNHYPEAIRDKISELVTNFPQVATRTLAKQLYKENSRFFKDLEQARSAIRRKRGNNGQKARKATKDKTGYRNNGKAGFVHELPPTQKKDWLPYVIPNGERIAVISDVHLPYHCEETLQRWYEDCMEYEPSVILINGDLLDFYRMSRFEKNPNMRDTAFEIDQAHSFFDWLQERFEAKVIFKEGNHDERWAKYIWNNAPEFSRFQQFDLASVLNLDSYGVDHVTEKRVINAGDLRIVHGHELYGGGGIQPARAMAAKMQTNALMGHCHRSSEFSQNNFEGTWLRCWSTGCMCEMNPDYGRINMWNHGYAFVDVHEDGSFVVDNVILEK